MTTPTRRRLLAALAVPALAACEDRVRPLPRNTALPPPRPDTSEPAPVPSAAATEWDAARRAARQPAPTGPDAMPGFDASQRLGTDMTTAPVPAERLRPRP